MTTFDQKSLTDTTLTSLEQLCRRIESCDVRVTNLGVKKGTFAYGSEYAPQYASDGTGALIVEYVNDKQAETAALLRPEPAVYVPEPGAYDEDLPDTDAAPEGHVERLKAEELAKAVRTLRDHADMLENGTLTLDGFLLVKPAELVESAAGLERTLAGTGNLALAFHDASARAAHLARAEVVVD